MVEYWKKLEHVKYQANCRECKRIIRVGQTAWWLKNWGLLHPNCGLGSKRFVSSTPAVVHQIEHVIYAAESSEKNPFENILEHNQVFHDAKKWRDSK